MVLCKKQSLLWGVLGTYRLCTGDLGHSRSVSRRVRSFFFFFFYIFVWESLSCNVLCCILIRRTPSLGSWAAALDEEQVSTYFLATYKGGFLVVFVSGVALFLFPRNNSCNF